MILRGRNRPAARVLGDNHAANPPNAHQEDGKGGYNPLYPFFIYLFSGVFSSYSFSSILASAIFSSAVVSIFFLIFTFHVLRFMHHIFPANNIWLLNESCNRRTTGGKFLESKLEQFLIKESIQHQRFFLPDLFE